MNIRFVVRALLLGMPLALCLMVGWVLVQTPIVRPPDPTPPPPTILAPAGKMPEKPVGLREWAQYHGDPYRPVGSGFLLLLDSGEVVGVTTAHSTTIGDPNHLLERIALGAAGGTVFVGEFDTLRGSPGRRFTVDDFTLDYALLQPGEAIEPDLALGADPRGAPQPGERVTLFSGVDGRTRQGTVQSAGGSTVWVLMDEWFNPSQLSGSPLVSQHTGQVVGMVVAGSPRLNRLLLGAHPIGSLVRLAESAAEFPRLVDANRGAR